MAPHRLARASSSFAEPAALFFSVLRCEICAVQAAHGRFPGAVQHPGERTSSL